MLLLPTPARRLVTVMMAIVMIALLPVMAIAGLVGLAAVIVDRRARLLRLAAMCCFYLLLELVTLAPLLGTWLLRPLRGRDRAADADMALIGWALGLMLAGARVLLGFQVELEEPSDTAPFDQEAPVLVLARHGGIGDSFALAHLLVSRYHRRPRIALKQALMWDPLFDVALSRLGACWVPGSSVPARRRGVQTMAESARPGDALLLFPEGANWTPRRRLSAMSRMWRAGRGSELRTAALLEHVLPPKTGGVLTCLDARPDIPVVVIAHTGLDKITSAGDLWRALPFRSPMRIRWWPAAPAPRLEDERVQWLITEWAVVDQWIAGEIESL